MSPGLVLKLYVGAFVYGPAGGEWKAQPWRLHYTAVLSTPKPQLLHTYTETHAPHTQTHTHKCTKIHLDKAPIKIRPYTTQHTKTQPHRETRTRSYYTYVDSD